MGIFFSFLSGRFAETDCADRVRDVFVAEDEGVEEGIEPADGDDANLSVVLRVVIVLIGGVEIKILRPLEGDAVLVDVFDIFRGAEGAFHRWLIAHTKSSWAFGTDNKRQKQIPFGNDKQRGQCCLVQ